jgi:8-oxo-dGTP pyrophosphatase MutT (NUDIX family)
MQKHNARPVLPTQRSERPKNIKKQIVAGFVIYRHTSDGVKFLLLYRRGEYWNFPKGHFEEGERSLNTALRETEEETGLKKSELRIVPDFRAYEKFHFERGDEKIYDTVILYLAETKQPNIRISPREHSGFAWFLYHDAVKVLRRYAGTRRVLKQAHDFIRLGRRHQGGNGREDRNTMHQHGHVRSTPRINEPNTNVRRP